MSEFEKTTPETAIKPDLKEIPIIDKEIVLLLSLFFKVKRSRIKIANGPVEAVEPVMDPGVEPGVNMIRWFFAQMEEEKSDIDGDVVEHFTEAILGHTDRNLYFPHLTNQGISTIVDRSNDQFEEAERNAESEGWSQYQHDPETFHRITPGFSIVNCNGFGVMDIKRWLSYRLEQRNAIIEIILETNFKSNLFGLLQQSDNK